MKSLMSVALTGILWVIPVFGVQTQTGTQPQKLMDTLKSKDLENVLLWASSRNDTTALKVLLDNGANSDQVRADGTIALVIEVQEGHPDNLKLLPEKGASP